MIFIHFAALHSLSLTNYADVLRQKMYEGKLLTLMCEVKGSDALTFQWFKDGDPINEHCSLR